MHSFVAAFALLSFFAVATIPAVAFADTTSATTPKHKSVHKPTAAPKSSSPKVSKDLVGRPANGQGE